MLNNDILRSLRYTLDLPDTKMAKLFEAGGADPARVNVSAMLKADDDPAYQPCNDALLSAFLDGLILARRGPPPEGSAAPAPAKRLGNNMILKKLRIAFELKQEDIQALLAQAGLSVSESELSALFRKPGHKHYRECHDQFLRNLLKGLALKLRP